MIKTTVICAVWNMDPARHELLKEHQENLDHQTINVERIYIFDNNDLPPNFLKGSHIICNHDLSIYEAWNLAITLCRTPFIMNLNLDDRLCCNAIEKLEFEIDKNTGDLIGGDWKITYTQDDTNNTSKCYPANSIPFVKGWPLPEGTLSRLGSGTGDRGTFGPATLWKISNHLKLPRYPYRTSDNKLIRSVADSVYWTLLINLKFKLVRIPIIIGHYHHHPSNQAEFRHKNDHALIENGGISFL